MIDDERIARVTELARMVWPNLENVRAWSEQWAVAEAGVSFTPMDADAVDQLASIMHPRALDALEAALCVLAGEPPTWATELSETWRARAGHPASDRSCRKSAARHIWDQCADELLAAARGTR